jgi:hypothetical protein
MSLNAGLVRASENIVLPGVAVAIGVPVIQIEICIVLCRVVFDGIVRSRVRRYRNSGVTVSRSGISVHVIARSREEQQAIRPIVAGVIVAETVVIGAIHGEPVLVVEGRCVSLENILGGGAALITAGRKATIDDEAKEVRS